MYACQEARDDIELAVMVLTLKYFPKNVSINLHCQVPHEILDQICLSLPLGLVQSSCTAYLQFEISVAEGEDLDHCINIRC